MIESVTVTDAQEAELIPGPLPGGGDGDDDDDRLSFGDELRRREEEELAVILGLLGG